MFTADIHEDASILAVLRGDWARLAAESPASTPWQQWTFIDTWWREFGSAPGSSVRRQLRLVVVRDEGRARMILPLQLSQEGPFGMRWLEPIGMPDDIHRPRLALGSSCRALYACALRALAARSAEWDGIRLDEKCDDDAERAIVQPIIDGLGWVTRTLPLHECPYLSLDTTWPEYLAGRSPKLRKNLSSAQRRLSAEGPVRIAKFSTLAEVREGFDVLLRVIDRSWKSKAKIGLASSARYRDFYRRFVDAMAAQERVRIYVLQAGERPVAATLAFIDGSTYYSTQIAHDAQFDACSPGTLLESLEMQDLMDEGRFRLFDFLGAALSNKRRWTDTMHSTDRILWLGRTARAHAFDGLYFRLKPRLRSVRESLRSLSS